jgi:membrane protease YdiL (CAAX protease family)
VQGDGRSRAEEPEGAEGARRDDVAVEEVAGPAPEHVDVNGHRQSPLSTAPASSAPAPPTPAAGAVPGPVPQGAEAPVPPPASPPPPFPHLPPHPDPPQTHPQPAYSQQAYPPQAYAPQASAPQAHPPQPPFAPTGFGPPPAGFPGTGPPSASPPGTPAGRTHKWGLGAFLLAELAFLVCSFLVGVLLLDPEAPSVPQLGVAVAVPTLVAAGIAIAATLVRGNGPARDLGLVWSWRDVGAGVAFGLGGLVLTTVAAMVWVSIVGPDVNSAVGTAFDGQRAAWPAALGIALLVVIVAPLCEEILYRGLLWGALERIGANRWLCFAVTTLVFALFHFELERAPLLLVISIPIGLARLYTGRLLAGIIAHQINNFLPGVVLFLALTGGIAV